TRDLLIGVAQLEQHTAGLHIGNPPLRRTLTGTHAGFGRLLGQRAVRVDVDPDLAATLDVPVDGDTSGLDLPVGDVRRLQCLDTEITEGDLGTATSHANPVRPVLLAVLDPAGNQHVDQTPVVSGSGAVASGLSSTAARPASVDVGVVPD